MSDQAAPSGTAPRTRRGAPDARAGAPVTAVLAALPALLLAVAGLVHPHSLTEDTAATWTWLHVVGLPLFPLVAVGLVLPLRGRRDPVAWVVRAAAYVYATFYTSLDVVSGITAGFVTSRLPAGAERPDEVRSIFAIGGPLGEVGSWALLVATGLLALDLLRRSGARAAASLLLPLGAWAVHADHIFSPWGVVGMVLLAAGTAGVLALVPTSVTGVAPASPATRVG